MFLQEALSSDSFAVYDSNDVDITEAFLQIYNTSGYDEANNLLKSVSGHVHFDTEEVQTFLQLLTPDQSNAIQTINTVGYDYVCCYDTTGVWQKEWQIALHGTYYRNTDNGQITGANAPTLELYYDGFGYAFNPYF